MHGHLLTETPIFETCPDCGRHLVNISGVYAVCPTGAHGKLYPAVTSDIHRKGLATMIPSAKEIELFEASKIPAYQPADGFNGRSVFTIQGKQGLFRRITRGSTGLKKSRPDSIVAHIGDDSIWEFVRWRAFDTLVFSAGYGTPPYDDAPPKEPAPKVEQKDLLPPADNQNGQNGTAPAEKETKEEVGA